MNVRLSQTEKLQDRRSRTALPAIALPEVTPRGCLRPVSETLPLAIARVAKALQPDKIILFGSYAYDAPTPDSDVDLLVIMETDKPVKERSWAVSRLLLPRDFPVDILVKTPAELAAALQRGDFFLREITERGPLSMSDPTDPAAWVAKFDRFGRRNQKRSNSVTQNP